MRILIRQSAVTLVLTALLWGALNQIIMGSSNVRDTVDTFNSPHRLTHQSQLAHLVEEMHLLAKTERPKLIFFGGSSMEYAFRAREIESLLPEYEVHSLTLNGSYGGGFLPETFEIMRAALAFIQPSARSRTVFVFGTIAQTFSKFGTFSEPHFTPARRRLFPLLYKVQEGDAVPRFGIAPTVLLHRIVRPFWIVRRVYAVIDATYDIFQGIGWLRGDAAGDALSKVEAFDIPDDPGRRTDVLRRAVQVHEDGVPADNFSREKFDELGKMLDFANQHKLRFIVVALPYSEVLRNETLTYFVQKIEKIVADHNQFGTLRFLDHTAAMPESLMRDPWHIDPLKSKRYAAVFLREWPFMR